MPGKVALITPEPATPGFDFTWHMRRLCTNLVSCLPELAHIELDQVAIAFRQTRKSVRHGVQATLTPLRFAGGSLFEARRGRTWTVQRLFDLDGREMLYILSFYLPRFMEHPLRESLVTVLHELWHISPAFDGDLRRHPGRCYAHSHSQHEYDTAMGVLADRWLAGNPDASLYGFLALSFRQLMEQQGPIRGLRIPSPKLLPVPREALPQAT